MIAFIIHTPHVVSRRYAIRAQSSFRKFTGWEPKLFEGLVPETLELFEEKENHKFNPIYNPEMAPIMNSRAMGHLQVSLHKYNIKKCCSLNHYRLFKKCVKIGKPIAVIEHDSHCIRNWTPVDFEDVLILNMVSALDQHVFRKSRHKLNNPAKGVHYLEKPPPCLKYKHNNVIRGAHIMPGTAAYAITPAGAQKMIDVYETHGWEQSDFMINTAFVNIQTIIPELFTFKLPNLGMSHGRNMEEVLI